MIKHLGCEMSEITFMYCIFSYIAIAGVILFCVYKIDMAWSRSNSTKTPDSIHDKQSKTQDTKPDNKK
jgi:hypothetical protein